MCGHEAGHLVYSGPHMGEVDPLSDSSERPTTTKDWKEIVGRVG